MGLSVAESHTAPERSDTSEAMTAGEVTSWLGRLDEEINSLKNFLGEGDESLDALEERLTPVLSSSPQKDGSEAGKGSEDPSAPLAKDLKDMCMALAGLRERYSRQLDRIQELERRSELD